MARFLIYNDLRPDIRFDEEGRLIGFGYGQEELMQKVRPSAFQTSGCPGCNRPFYNERPGGALYNYPYVPTREEHVRALREAVDSGGYHG